MVLAIEKLAASQDGLVATVGRLKVLPGVQNVIPGRVEFTIDMRSPSDALRRRAHAALLPGLREIAGRRGVGIEIDTFQQNPAVALHESVIDAVTEAIAACGEQPLRLPSGAGHDAGIMTRLCPSGMMFVRCKDGVSHNPAESITVEDADLAVRALLDAVRRLDRRLAA
jgi:acetylornithine deacetylase/succinyl-diaminopimelate desuccinylase-like protein